VRSTKGGEDDGDVDIVETVVKTGLKPAIVGSWILRLEKELAQNRLVLDVKRGKAVGETALKLGRLIGGGVGRGDDANRSTAMTLVESIKKIRVMMVSNSGTLGATPQEESGGGPIAREPEINSGFEIVNITEHTRQVEHLPDKSALSLVAPVNEAIDHESVALDTNANIDT
jgi:hypothetical protein